MSDLAKLFLAKKLREMVLPRGYNNTVLIQAADKIADLEESLHYTSGCCDLAMKHRDIAEAEVERLEKRNAELEAELQNRECYGEWCGKSPSKKDKGLCPACDWKDKQKSRDG